jgi:hypothetical protein
VKAEVKEWGRFQFQVFRLTGGGWDAPERSQNLPMLLTAFPKHAKVRSLMSGVLKYFLMGIICCLAVSFVNGENVLTLANPQMKLGLPAWANGTNQMSLTGEADVSYITEVSTDLITWAPIATNINSPVVSVAAPDKTGFYRISRNPLPLCEFALAAVTNITANGNGVLADSFNSGNTNFSTNGQYDPAKASTNGNVASVQGLVNLGNHEVEGDLYLGPTAGYAGSSGAISGTINANGNIQFPDVVLPNVFWIPAPGTSSAHDFTANGYYTVSDSGAMTIEPGVVAVLQLSSPVFNPSTVNILGGMTNSGTVIIYQTSGSWSLTGNSPAGAVNGQPKNYIYLGLSGVTNINLSNLSNFVGVIYAPEAALTLNGSGSVIGSCITGSVMQYSHYSVHFDEDLLTSGPFR